MTGGISFEAEQDEIVNCYLCKYRIPMDDILEAKANAYKTKLIEESYNYKFTSVKST